MRYVNGTLTRSEIASGGINNRIANYQTMDVSGDGINEIMVMYDDGYKIYNMKANNGFSFALFLQGNLRRYLVRMLSKVSVIYRYSTLLYSSFRKNFLSY